MRRRMRAIGVVVASVLLLAVGLASQQYDHILHQSLRVDPQDDIIWVERGSNSRRIAETLYARGMTRVAPYWLVLYTRLHGHARHIQAGEYRIEAHMTYPQVIAMMRAGRVVQHSITLVEGTTLAETLTLLQAHPAIARTESLDTKTLITHFGDLAFVEGWLMPETYFFTRNTPDIAVLKRAHQAMRQALEQRWETRDPNLPFSRMEDALVLASLIEKETGVPEERGEIAGVFVNRLRLGMRLQTDPTVIYGLGDTYTGVLRRSDLQLDTPFNTYTRAGLPPTPICLPSLAALDAAFFPNQTDNLYFVASERGDGSHVFSQTLEQHNRAVQAYRRSLGR